MDPSSNAITLPPYPMLRAAIHDLKGPAGHVALLAELVLGAGDSPDPKLLHHLSEASARLQMVIDALKQYVDVAGRRPSPFQLELAELFELAAFGVRNMHGGDQLQVRTGALHNVFADREQIAWIIAELLRNAVRFRSDRSPEVIVASEVVVPSDKSPESRCRILFQDNGVGVDEEIAERMFLPFTKLGTAAGAGLGLHLCRVLAEMNGGVIGFRPATSGACVVLDLPLRGDLV